MYYVLSDMLIGSMFPNRRRFVFEFIPDTLAAGRQALAYEKDYLRK